MKGQLPEKCDVAIIGAGMGGLTSAALLAKAGLEVCVLDRESRPGGYLAGFRRSRFVFDSAIHWLNQCGPGGVVRKVFDFIGPGAPEAPALRKIRRYKGESFDYLLTSNPDDLKEQLKRDFPEDAAAIDKLFRAARAIGERMMLYANMMRAAETRDPLEKVLHGLRLTYWSFPFWRYLPMDVEGGFRKLFKNPKLAQIFCSEQRMLSVLVPIGWAYVGDFQEPPAGGSQAFAEWLRDKILELGSHVVLRAKVKEVMLDDNGRAAGVRLESGRELRARYVIGACDVEALYERMLPPGTIPEDLLKRLREAELYESCVTLSIGLNVNPRTLGFDEELVFLSRDGIAREEHNCGDPDKAGLSILAPSLRDPTLAPEGKGTLTIYAGASIEYGDYWKTEPGLVRGEAYKAFKQAYADKILDRVERAMAPNLRQHIEILSVATPITHLRYTGNRNGSIMGALTSKKNMKLKLAHYRTPVPGLFLGGHWAEYGGGVPIAVKAGANVAAIILQGENEAAFRELKNMLDRPHQAPRELPDVTLSVA